MNVSAYTNALLKIARQRKLSYMSVRQQIERNRRQDQLREKKRSQAARKCSQQARARIRYNRGEGRFAYRYKYEVQRPAEQLKKEQDAIVKAYERATDPFDKQYYKQMYMKSMDKYNKLQNTRDDIRREMDEQTKPWTEQQQRLYDNIQAETGDVWGTMQDHDDIFNASEHVTDPTWKQRWKQQYLEDVDKVQDAIANAHERATNPLAKQYYKQMYIKSMNRRDKLQSVPQMNVASAPQASAPQVKPPQMNVASAPQASAPQASAPQVKPPQMNVNKSFIAGEQAKGPLTQVPNFRDSLQSFVANGASKFKNFFPSYMNSLQNFRLTRPQAGYTPR